MYQAAQAKVWLRDHSFSSTPTLCALGWRSSGTGFTKSSELFYHSGQASIGSNRGKMLFATLYINSEHFSKEHDEDLNLEIFLRNPGKRSLATRKTVCRRASRSLRRKVKEISSEILIILISPSHPILHLGQRVGKTFPPAKGDSSTKKGRTNLCLQPLEGWS